ncbi:hypothetical protein J6W91_00790 [Candidatus Saccharibacteria bacterium]|nr:hypothetical protein [Candidatus Saccharibacteria bacterium]
MTGGNIFYSKLQRWADEFKLAVYGALLCFRKKRFLIAFFIAFIIFGTLLNLLASGGAAFSILSRVSFPEKIALLGKAFIGTFGVNREFSDFLFIFLMTVLQSTLIGLVSFVYKYRKDTANIQNAGIITGLIVLGSGCPTCGTTILAPIIVSIAGSSGMALASTLSWVLTILSFLVALFALKKVGFEAYAIIKSEEFEKKKAEKVKKSEKKKGKK